ncbi:MAG: FtsB family cell division protein [Candidatus Puniceispirillaceae bacterium]
MLCRDDWLIKRVDLMYVMRKTLTFAGSFVLLGTMIVFFGVHTVTGERGILARPQLERKILLAEEQLALLEKHQHFLNHRITLMNKGGVDADILAETARAELGLYAPNDVIVSIDLSDLKF